ncbi:hypothetical protein GALMADRAFT_139351 [Galerina marginata CBS 339.88]|uniref:Uncharacterized protein n=1 Tax=Galerina marginata (strain CBS 339.88) TaxID=685588 RepID=A0A067TEG8_GALM3|nr:hypothetical protein GALMADRAFT_139351 [Galerina marginata CBS 339.88]
MLISASHYHHHHCLLPPPRSLHLKSVRRVPLASHMWAGAFRARYHRPRPPTTPIRDASTHRANSRGTAPLRDPAPPALESPPMRFALAHPLPLSKMQNAWRRILEPGNSACRLHHPLPTSIVNPYTYRDVQAPAVALNFCIATVQ